MSDPIYTADAIIKYGESFVLIERLTTVCGLSLSGGKQDPGELLSDTVVREAAEETGLNFAIEAVLGTYATPGRDPRGNYVSTVFIGRGQGELRAEPGKTKIVLLSRAELLNQTYVFDHGQMIADFLART